jgi:putative redox protein
MAVTASAQWTDGERFIAQASSKHAIVVDSSSDKTANGPMELVLMALCSCTATDVVSILRKKREPFTSVEVMANGERAPEPPTVYTNIHLTYRVGGKVNHKSVEDAVHLSKTKYCSVSQMLQKSTTITYEIEYLDSL